MFRMNRLRGVFSRARSMGLPNQPKSKIKQHKQASDEESGPIGVGVKV